MNATPAHPADVLDRNLQDGREAYDRKEWKAAYAFLLAADSRSSLDPDDLERLAKSAYIVGDDAAGGDILARAHKRFMSERKTLAAVRCAFWLGFSLLIRGDQAQAGGWLSRAARLLEDQEDCVEKGYLLLPDGFRSVRGGNPVAAFELFRRASEIGLRFNDSDLMTYGLNGQGRALIQQGDIARGLALLDEAMVAVTGGEVSALTAGGIYCSVIEACSDLFDLRRAQEWTGALDRWCASQPDQLPYRGHCMLRRSEILQLHGDWSGAETQAEIARDQLLDSDQKRNAGAASYQLAELHRLRGEFDKAETAYRQASEYGSPVQPGLARLRLLQGQIDVAVAALRNLPPESRQIRQRATLLESVVEIMLSTSDVASARSAAEELEQLAQMVDAPLLHAISKRASGSVSLAANEADSALAVLRQALDIFQELGAPYEEARVRVLIARACGSQDDCDTAELELEAARRIFERLEARPDLAEVLSLLSPGSPTDGPGPLTTREVEVLKLIASGMTNRAIASNLFISEKTVARHVSNIFVKLDLSSRAAATAYAYQHHLT